MSDIIEMRTFEIVYTFTVDAKDEDDAIDKVQDLLFCGEEHSVQSDSITGWERDLDMKEKL